MSKVKTWITWALAFVLAVSVIGFVAAFNPKTASAEEQTAENTYLIPLNGYVEARETMNLSYNANDSGVSVWFTTNWGLGKENLWQNLGSYAVNCDSWATASGSNMYETTEEEMVTILEDINDHILINGKTMLEIMQEDDPAAEITAHEGGTAFWRVMFHWDANGHIALRFHTDQGVKYNEIETFTIKAGFQWYDRYGNKLGAPTDRDYTLYNDQTNNQFVWQLKQTDEGEIDSTAVVLASEPTKMTYYKGDTFDPTGISFDVVYEDTDANGANITETLTADDIVVGTYDFTGDEGGTVTVPIYVNGYVYNLEVNYSPIQIDTAKLDQIEIDGLADSYTLETSISGLTLNNVPYTDGTTGNNIALTAENINAPVVYVGECTGYITYLNATIEFTYNVVNNETIPITLEIDSSNYPIFQATVNNRLGFKVTIPGSSVSRKAIENVQMATWINQDGEEVSIGDFIYINGVSYTQLASEYKVRKLLAYGDTLLIDVYTSTSEVTEDEIPAEYIGEDGMPIGYLTYDTIYTIELKEGFTYVTADADSWGLGTSEEDSKNYYPVPGGYLTNSVLLVRYPATSSLTRWMCPLATTDYTSVDAMVTAVLGLAETPEDYTRSNLDALFENVTDDAAVITSPGITEFEVGDDYDAEGLEVTVKYLDGGTEVMTFNSAAIQGFDSEEAGTCDCYVTVNNIQVHFTVTIKEATSGGDTGGDDNTGGDNTGDDSTGGGCSSSALGIGIGAAVLSVTAAAAAVVLIRKKRA